MGVRQIPQAAAAGVIQQVAAPADLLGDVLGDVARPAFKRVEAEHADRIFVLALDQFARFAGS